MLSCLKCFYVYVCVGKNRTGVKYDDKFSIDDISGYRDSLLLKKRKSNNVAQ
jgi:hypothetical protein